MTQYTPIKQTLVSACHLLVDKGYLKATEGNLSLRAAGEAAFVITPSSYDYTKMQPEDICVLDFALQRIEGEMKPSIESGMHAAVYQNRPDVHAVIHTHQVYASALALINAPIPALFDEQVRFLGRSVPIISYAPSGTGFLKGNVKGKVRDGGNAYILQNHGVLVFGGDLERAIHNLALLEKCALAYLLALLSERKTSKIPLAIREIAFAKLKADEKRFAEQTPATDPA